MPINVSYPVSGQPGSWTATCGSCIDASGNFTPTGLDVGEYFISYETPGACGGTDEINFIVYGAGLEVETPVNVCLGDVADLNSTITFVENFIVYDSIYSDPGITIDDNGGVFQTHTMTISDKPGSAVNGSIYKICIDITIDDAEDMDVYIECPDGLEIRLVTDNGKTGDNFTNTCFIKDQAPSINSDNNASQAPFTEIYTPEQPIANLNTCALNGDWTIKFDDDNYDGNHVDVLNAWSIILQEAYVPTDILWVQTSPISGAGSSETITNSDQEDATVTPSVVGSGIYQIQVSDNAGCTETANVEVITTDCCPAYSGGFN